MLMLSSCLTLCDTINCSPPVAPLSLEFSRQEYWSGLPFPTAGDLLISGIEPMSPALQSDSLPSEPPGKPKVKVLISPADSLPPHGLYPTRLLCPWHSLGKNTGVGSHSFLQRIFLTQRLNPGLLHCRQIVYHLSH